MSRRLVIPKQGGVCRVCGAPKPPLAAWLGVCCRCLRERPEEALLLALEAHSRARRGFNLPERPPDHPDGVRCGLCLHECRIGEGQVGYCGLRENRQGRLHHRAGTPRRGMLHYYNDPLPTNCVADWVCPERRSWGKVNLAVFYGSCTLDCFFCQNWHYRRLCPHRDALSAEGLAGAATSRTACVCFFGGDPASQMPHALATGRLLARQGKRVCWETNGTMHPNLLERAVALSLESGGIVKFDLKAWSEPLHIALTGATNRRTLENLRRAARHFRERPEPPPVVAATLLVPGYVDEEEVGQLARYIASLDPEIPYALLAFAPAFFLSDLPTTSQAQAQACLEAARAAGLNRVRLGNVHLLGWEE